MLVEDIPGQNMHVKNRTFQLYCPHGTASLSCSYTDIQEQTVDLRCNTACSMHNNKSYVTTVHV